MALALTIDCPNRSPKPASDWAAALSVRFSLTGSTFCAISVMVWNNVLISVVTDRASMHGAGQPGALADVTRCGEGFCGVVNDTYLPPNTVVALMSAFTLDGINLR